MLPLLLLLCALGALALPQLPDVTVTLQDGQLAFSMTNDPDLKLQQVHVTYQLGSSDDVIPARLKAVIKDGEWRAAAHKVALEVGDAVQYAVEGWTHQGDILRTDVTNWVYAPAPTPGPRRLRGAVVFMDTFDGEGAIDGSHWDTEISMYGGMNWEFQVYTPELYNVRRHGGNLMLKPTLTTDDPRWDENWLHSGIMDMAQLWGHCTQSAQYGCRREGRYGILPPVMSGKVKSKATIRYGTVEVRARIPKGDWIWPAIWMLPRDNHYGGWPRSGEIDIMESRGNVQASGHGVNQVSSTLHWGTSPGDNHYGQTTHTKNSADWSNQFHTWKLEWTHDHLVTYVDNQEVLRVTPPSGGFASLGHTSNIWAGNDRMAPFDKDFYLILNVAIGGTNGFFPDGWNYGYSKPWSNNSPHAAQDWWQNRARWQSSWQGDKVAMEIDYVKMSYL